MFMRVSSHTLDINVKPFARTIDLADGYLVGMLTVEEIRATNLRVLVSQGHTQARISVAMNKSPKQVNQWFGKGSKRAISSATCRELEAAVAKPRGWMDNVNSAEWASIGVYVTDQGLDGPAASPDRPNASQVTDGVQKNISSGSRNLRTESVIVREGIVMVATYFKALHSEVRVEEDTDLLVKGYEAFRPFDPDLWEEIYSEIEARVQHREAANGQEQGGVKGSGRSGGVEQKG